MGFVLKKKKKNDEINADRVRSKALELAVGHTHYIGPTHIFRYALVFYKIG